MQSLKPERPIALQLYTVRAAAQRDFVGTLEQLATIGYRAVQLSGLGGMRAAALKATLDRLGLSVAGMHVGLPQLEQQLDRVIADALQLEAGYIVCPKLPVSLGRYQASGLQAAARRLQAIGATCVEHGLQFCYHNHAFEFRRYGHHTGLDLLLTQTDPHVVQAEIDVYWARYAGHDPAALIRGLAGRVPLLHLKDMRRGWLGPTFTEIGSGVLDWTAIFAAAAAAGTVWFIIEQDRTILPPFESARLSLAYLQSLFISAED